MRLSTSFFIAAWSALAVLASATAASAGSWDEIRSSVYGKRAIEDGHGIVTLTAPYRPEDMRKVPIRIDAALSDGRTVKAVTFLIDENPTPVVAVFNVGGERDEVSFQANFRVDRQSDVRAIVEASDGQLYMVSQLVKFAGGQASCSAPPQGDPKEIAASMGQMSIAQLKTEGAASHAIGEIRLDTRHPNHTGMVMDQITLLYTPMRMVSEITVESGSDVVLKVEGSIALSQDPSITFDYKRANIHDLKVTMKDTDGGEWSKSFPIGPET